MKHQFLNWIVKTCHTCRLPSLNPPWRDTCFLCGGRLESREEPAK